MKRAITIATIVVTIIGIVIGLIAYSYTQIQIHLDNVSFGGFDWAPASLMTLAKLAFNALTGNLIGTVLSLITGLKLNLIFSLSNHGILPVYVPNLSYNLSVNGVNVGQGQSTVDVTIDPGETKSLPVTQDFQISSLEPAATSVLEAGGVMNIQVSGTAYFKFLGLTIPVPFQSTKEVNVVEEAKNRFLGSNSQNSGSSTSPNQPSTITTNINIQSSAYSVTEGQSVILSGLLTDSNGNGIPNQLVYVKRDISLGPDSILDSSYTDSNGYFTVTWIATKPITSNTANVYAIFEGSSNYSSARSSDITIQVVTYQITPPSITQNPSQSITIANSVYKVGPGTYTFVSFYSPCSSTVTGFFSAHAALGNNIIVYLMDENNFNIYKNGNSPQTYYNSGKVASGNFNVDLASGTYYSQGVR